MAIFLKEKKMSISDVYIYIHTDQLRRREKIWTKKKKRKRKAKAVSGESLFKDRVRGRLSSINICAGRCCCCCRRRWDEIIIIVCFVSGYGNLTPRTAGGKLATVLYALVGIPLMLLYMANVGDILATSFKFTYKKMCKSVLNSAISSGKRIGSF